jgi:signal peptidase I
MDPTLKAEVDKINAKIESYKNKIEELESKKKNLIKGIKFIDFEKEQTCKKLEDEFVGKILKRVDRYDYTYKKDEKKVVEVVKYVTFTKVTGIFFTQTAVGLVGDEVRFTLPEKGNMEYRNAELGIKTGEKHLTGLKCIYGDPGARDLRKEYSAEDFIKDFYSSFKLSSVEELIKERNKVLTLQQNFYNKNLLLKVEE